MKNFRITENDKKYITDLYKSKNIFLEQTVATGSDTESTTPSKASTTPYNYSMAELQQLVKEKGGSLGNFGPKKDGVDGKYGNWTASAILTLLNKPDKSETEQTQQAPQNANNTETAQNSTPEQSQSQQQPAA